jgi:hypothetical protein
MTFALDPFIIISLGTKPTPDYPGARFTHVKMTFALDPFFIISPGTKPIPNYPGARFTHH